MEASLEQTGCIMNRFRGIPFNLKDQEYASNEILILQVLYPFLCFNQKNNEKEIMMALCYPNT